MKLMPVVFFFISLFVFFFFPSLFSLFLFFVSFFLLFTRKKIEGEGKTLNKYKEGEKKRCEIFLSLPFIFHSNQRNSKTFEAEQIEISRVI